MWILNTIETNNPDILPKFVDENDDFKFELVIPIPKEFCDNAVADDWCWKNWGVIHDAVDTNFDRQLTPEEVSFYTEDRHPTLVFQKLCSLYPGEKMILHCEDDNGRITEYENRYGHIILTETAVIDPDSDEEIPSKFENDIYLAGPFFNQYEAELNSQAATILRNRGLSVFVPREHFVHDGENMPNDAWGRAVFEMDKEALEKCKYIVALYHGMYSDSGTAWEIGYAYALGKQILVVCVSEDKSSVMIANGSASVIDGVEGLKDFDFVTFPKKMSATEQK